MMYVFWFLEFIWQTVIVEPFQFAGEFILLVIDVIENLGTLISAFPNWLSVPFGCLLVIAVLFRVSQFIPSLGGASN